MDSIDVDALLPTMDWEHLHHISDNNPEFELELLQLFVSDSQTQIDRLLGAIASQNFLDVEQIAHHIKGASANIGAIEIQDAAEKLERQAREKQLEQPEALYEVLKIALSRIQRFLEVKQEG